LLEIFLPILIFDKIYRILVYIVEKVGEFCIGEQVFLQQAYQTGETPAFCELLLHNGYQ
jgi:hypothetical protein